MTASELNKFLLQQASSIILSEKISNEVSEYVSLMKNKGSSIPLYFQEDEDIFLSNSSVLILLNETYNGNLSNMHLAYICDCLTIGENVIFENENIKDIIFSLADPEINGGFRTTDEILILINQIIG